MTKLIRGDELHSHILVCRYYKCRDELKLGLETILFCACVHGRKVVVAQNNCGGVGKAVLQPFLQSGGERGWQNGDVIESQARFSHN